MDSRNKTQENNEYVKDVYNSNTMLPTSNVSAPSTPAIDSKLASTEINKPNAHTDNSRPENSRVFYDEKADATFITIYPEGDYRFKIFIVGDSKVGKSALVHRYADAGK